MSWKFYNACQKNNLEKVKELSNQIDDINWGNPNDFNYTGLHIACSLGNKEIVEYLISHPKINVNKEDHNGETPLYIACYYGYEEIVKILLKDERVNVNKEDNYGATPLWRACWNGRVEIVKILLKDKRADVNKEKNNGETPLWIACSNRKEEIVKILFASGREIDTTKKTNANHWKHPNTTAAEIAREKGKEQIEKLVDEYAKNPKEIIVRLRNEMSKYFVNYFKFIQQNYLQKLN